MNSTTKAWIAAGAGILFSVGLIVWQVRAGHAAAVNLNADDMTQIAQDQNAQARQRLAADDKARKDFAKNVRELLSVAEEARFSTAPVKFQNPDGTWVTKEPIRNRPDIKRQLELIHALVISQNYAESQSANPAAAQASDADIDNFFKEPGQEDRFNQFVKDAQARNPAMAAQQIPWNS